MDEIEYDEEMEIRSIEPVAEALCERMEDCLAGRPLPCETAFMTALLMCEVRGIRPPECVRIFNRIMMRLMRVVP